jgi:class 3 adenylate cyclase
MSPPSLFHRLLNLGVPAGTDPREARYAVVGNVAAWGSFLSSFFGTVVYAVTGQTVMVEVGGVMVLGYAAALGIAVLGHLRAARIALVIVAVAAILSVGLATGPAAGTDIFFMAMLSAIWLGFPPKERATAWLATALVAAGIAGLRIIGPRVGPLVPMPHPEFAAALNVITTFTLIVSLSVYARRRTLAAEHAIDTERARSEALLRNMLPQTIAEQLKDAPRAIAQGHDAVTVLFADIVGFTPLSQTMTPHELVRLLNDVFSAFDEMARRHGLEKIKTIGDAYMVVGGVPAARADHAAAVAAMALEMRGAITRFHPGLNLRLGMHTGPAVAGVIGTAKYSYDLWGDTVNTAARMESHGEPGRIQLTAECRDALGDRFVLEARGTITVKGKGELSTFWLVGPG